MNKIRKQITLKHYDKKQQYIKYNNTGGVNTAFLQSPISGFMQGKGKGNVSLSSEKYDKVYLVPQETNGVPILTK
jgi:hypothetical protein